MLLKRQAPGRDFHKHFSLAPARSDTNPKQPATRPRSQSPTRQGSSSQCDVESTPPVTHLSRSPRPTPLAPSYPRPTPSPLPSSTAIERRLKRHIRGREGHRRVSSQETGDIPRLNCNATHPAPPALPSPMYCRTVGRQNPCLCPECCHAWPGGANADICERLLPYGAASFASSWLPSWRQW